MKKFLVVLVALLATVAMIAPAFAEDRLSLSGSMQVRGMFSNLDDGTDDASFAWNDQRLRIAGKFSVAEGVSVNFRMDATESAENSSDAVAWGGSYTGLASGGAGNPRVSGSGAAATQYSHRRGDIQFDKAYLQLEKGGYTFKAGQNYFGGFGVGNMIDVVGAGFTVMRDGLTLHHVKRAESQQDNANYDSTGFSDSSLTTAKYVIKSGDMTLVPMVAYGAIEGDGDRMGLGLFATAKLGAIDLKGELNYFDGETPSGLVDEVGMNLFLDAGMALNDTTKVGVHFLFAPGTDKADETQVTNMNEYQDGVRNIDYTFADFAPLQYGPWSTDFVDLIDPFEISTNAGMTAVQLYADVKPNADMKLQFAAAFAAAEEDQAVDGDGMRDYEAMSLNASVVYNLMANTALSAHANYIQAEATDAVSGVSGDLDILQVISGVVVKF